MEFGVQTFTIRKAQKKSIRAAYLPLIKSGVRSFEVARIDFNQRNAAELKALVDEYGIEIVAVQVKPRYVFESPDKIIEFCKIVGCKNVVISMLPFKCILGGEDKFYSFVASLDNAAEIYAKHGIILAYHHHNWEYLKLSNGKTRMDELISQTKIIKFVHDTYWTAGCGISPALQITRFGPRLLGIHLRDLTFRKRGIDVVRCDCAVGEGAIDFGSVILTAEQQGKPYYVIEQKTNDPYTQLEKSIHALAAIVREMKDEE